jgi:hypothetical protein
LDTTKIKATRMARTLRDSTLETRAARARLKARGKPYYRVVEEGLHLGYRRVKGRPGKPAAAGKWVLRTMSAIRNTASKLLASPMT